MGKVLYWTLQFFAKLVRSIYHVILALSYCGSGKRVPPVYNPMLLKSATKLAEEIRERKLRSEDVVHAYMQRILEIEPYINATVDRPFLDAMAEAKQADALVASGKYTTEQLKEHKPLLGVPISVKVLLKVKGLRCTAGSQLFPDKRASEDSPSVSLMREAGAIVIATTNSAEMGMDFETNNKAHGKTCNPYDTHRTSGGSSGGESALVSAAGSVLGLGNDLLGSIRVPCHFTGLFGHKPTMGLVPNGGVFPEPDPKMACYLYTGPMCRYSEDLITSMRILSQKYETKMEFGKPVDFRKIKICYMSQLRSPLVAPVDNVIKEGLNKAVAYFTKAYNVTPKEIHIPLLYDVNRCVLSNLLSPLKRDVKDVLTNGQATHINHKKDLVKCLFGHSVFSRGPLVVMNFGKNPIIYKKDRALYYAQMLKDLAKEFDHILGEDTVLLMPTLPIVAPYHTEMLPQLPSTCYTSMFNCLGLPSTQCPLGLNKDGIPFGIQIVGRKNNDPLTIACAVELGKEFGGWISPGST